MTAQVTNTSNMKDYLLAYLNHRAQDNRPNRTGQVSLSAAYRYLRSLPIYSSVGDYPILYVAAATLRSKFGARAKINVLTALNASEEFHGKFQGKKEIIKNLTI